jgi:hypothetical protein
MYSSLCHRQSFQGTVIADHHSDSLFGINTDEVIDLPIKMFSVTDWRNSNMRLSSC